MAKKPKAAGFKPFAAKLTYSTLFPNCIVAAESFEGYLVVYERPAMPEIGPLGLGVCCLWWHKDRVDCPKASVIRDENTTLQVAITRIKKSMLDHGAVAEAVQLIGAISPFEEKELKIMAEKLKGKAAPAKDTAKKAPAKGGAKGGNKGNPEALAKAQEAAAGKRAEMRARKIKPLKKVKDIEAREGSFRHQMLQDVLAAKTVGDFYDAAEKNDAGCLKFAIDNGYVSVG